MKTVIKITIGLCASVLVSSDALAGRKDNFLHFFVGVNLGPTMSSYDKISGSFPYISKSDLSKKPYVFEINGDSGWEIGLDTGFRLFNENHVYHPGLRFFTEGYATSGNLDLYVNNSKYGSYEIDIDSSLQGYGFDNYIRILKGDDGDSGYFVIGIDYGKIETEYLANGVYDYGYFPSRTQRNNLYRFNIGFLQELSSGWGFNVTIGYSEYSGGIIKNNFSLKTELRYTY